MIDKLANTTKWILYTLMILSVVVMGYTFANGGENVNVALYFGYIMICLVVVAMVCVPIYGIVINPGSVKGILVGLGCAVVVYLIAYLMSLAANALPQEYLESMEVGSGVDSFAGVCVNFLYVMVAGVLLSIIYSVVFKMFRK